MRGALGYSFRPQLILAALLLVPTAVFANAGTPLMWLSLAHLFIGNAILGLVEGLLLAWWFRVEIVRAVGLMVLANYASAWGGSFLLRQVHPDVTIENLRSWLAIFVVLAFALTLLIEFPFVLFSFASWKKSARRAIWATLAVNVVTYLALFQLYWSASGTSMLTRLRVVSAAEMQPPAGILLYTIDVEGAQVLRMDLSGRDSRVIRTLEARDDGDRLSATQNTNGKFDLSLLKAGKNGEKTRELLVPDFAVEAAVEGEQDSWRAFFDAGPVRRLTAGGGVQSEAGVYGYEGITGVDESHHRKFHYALETPFASWPVRNATQIDDDFIVLQLGRNQICLLQPWEKKIALISRGKGPVVARATGN